MTSQGSARTPSASRDERAFARAVVQLSALRAVRLCSRRACEIAIRAGTTATASSATAAINRTALSQPRPLAAAAFDRATARPAIAKNGTVVAAISQSKSTAACSDQVSATAKAAIWRARFADRARHARAVNVATKMVPSSRTPTRPNSPSTSK